MTILKFFWDKYRRSLFDIAVNNTKIKDQPVILVMDYAFGEQAYETIDELLKPVIKGKDVYQCKISIYNG